MRPFEFRVFLAAGEAERERDRGRDNDDLPAPEVHPAQEVREHPRLAQPLERIVDPHEHAVADEGEDDGVRVQRPQPPERGVLEIEVQVRPEELAGDEQSPLKPTRPQMTVAMAKARTMRLS